LALQRVLIASSNRTLREALTARLQPRGHTVFVEKDLTHVIDRARGTRANIVFLGPFDDCNGAGLASVTTLKRFSPFMKVVLFTDSGSEELAVSALRAGCDDYVKASSTAEEFDKILNDGSVGTPTFQDSTIASNLLVGRSGDLQEVRQCVQRVAPTDSTVLITGDTGTGKELVAEMIHRNSCRKYRRMMSINCAAIPEDLIESELFGHARGTFTGADKDQRGKVALAAGGSLFLDEISEIRPSTQAKLLRLLESRELQRLGDTECIRVDVRFIAATNEALEERVHKGSFRRDLYYRLNVNRIHLTPLASRKEDIELLCKHFLNEFNSRYDRGVKGYSDAAFDLLLGYEWPGNVRELRNITESCVINARGDYITIADLPREMSKEGVVSDERIRLLSALHAVNWNKSKAAERLNWSRMTVYRKIKKYHIIEGGADARNAPRAHVTDVTRV
jgi:two-component system response regulator HydG/two-component system response regulator AtoC